MNDYAVFLESKRHEGAEHGFAPLCMHDRLYPFQQHLTEWAIRKGRAGVFADCGLGKTPMQLVWADNVVQRTGKSVLILTPLAVSYQTVREAEKFGIEAIRSPLGKLRAPIVVTNYERLHAFDPSDLAGVVCDESSILKNFNGKRRGEITGFMRKVPYRLLCTATAAPNDYNELGTASEALGGLGYMDMLGRFFRNQQNNNQSSRTNLSRWQRQNVAHQTGWERVKWRLKGHAETGFWRWVCSWARACRSPSDVGFDDDCFTLPPLTINEHVVSARQKRPDMLFDLPAVGLREEREERRRTLNERCEMVRDRVNHNRQALVWCQLNDEGDLLTKLITDAEQVKGSDSDDRKERRLLAFQKGTLRVLVTKPKIGAWGLNLQGCSHVTFFPSHSYEQYYQGIRRCWRFGQQNEVVVDVISTEGERGIVENLKRKSDQADHMFAQMVTHMNDAMNVQGDDRRMLNAEVPSWL